MERLTLLQMLETNKYENILQLKLALIRFRNDGTIFFNEQISSLEFNRPFEFYFCITKGKITYINAFPVPTSIYARWMNKSNARFHSLLPYYQSYYETKIMPDEDYFQSLYLFEGEKYVWFYRDG